MNELKIDAALAHELFYYDPESPTGLRHKKDNGGRGLKKRIAHDAAGYVDKESGYFSITFNRRPTRVHRIICVLNGLNIEGKQVDHIDGNAQNNKFENLRLVDFFGNARNQKPRANKKIKVLGVHLSQTRKSKAYRATFVDLDKNVRSKSFSIMKYGEEKALNLAKQWRESQIQMLNKFGAGYTDRHLGIEP